MIVVCGEALIDLFAGEPSMYGFACRAVAGGSPFNGKRRVVLPRPSALMC
jgi:hypothetical protein